MPYCEKCGSIATDQDAQFCTRCGSALEQQDNSFEGKRRPLHEASKPTPDPATPSNQRVWGKIGVGCLVVVVASVVLAVVVSICGPSDTTSGLPSDTSRVPSTELDPSASLACMHFKNVTNDAKGGIFTDAELRVKLREVYDDARYSDDSKIRQAATNLLRTATPPVQPEEFEWAIIMMAAACE